MRRKAKKGSGLFATVANAGLWGFAYAKSDGSFWDVLKLRFWYGFLILAVIATPILLIVIIYYFFGKKTPAEDVHKPK